MRRIAASAALMLLAACQPSTQEDNPVAPPASSTAPAGVGDAVALSARPETRVFRDWRVTCDNGAACVAFAPAVELDAGWLRLEMAPDVQAAPQILVGPFTPGQPTAAAPDRAPRLTVDGRTFDLTSMSDASVGRVAGPDATTVVRALASGRAAALSQNGRTVPLSLTGAAAAMLWIDERQARLDTPGALVRVGDRPARTRAPDLPRITPAPAADQTGFGGESPTLPAAIEALDAVKACRRETEWNEYVQKAVVSARLGPQQEFWAVPCFAGAYNLGVRAYVTGPGGRDPQPVAFPTASGSPTDTVVNAEYDPATRALTAFNKGRGIGDCGMEQSWTWTGRGFVLKSEREMRDCMGVPPDLWPDRWRTR